MSVLQPIDIRSLRFFWLIQPWKEGKLATIDGWGRFAEISFVGANRMNIKPLVNFPRRQIDRQLITWPEAGLIASTSGKMHHLAAVDDRKTKSHIPLLTWVHSEFPAILLDHREGLVIYRYSLKRNRNDVNNSLFFYNYREDRMVHESRDEFPFLPIIAMNEQYMLSYHSIFDGSRVEHNKVFHNVRTNEILENDLTKTIHYHRHGLIFRGNLNINLEKRFLFMSSLTLQDQKIKITWDENYSDVKTIPINYLAPEGKKVNDFIISSDGKWATSIISGYRGLNNENLSKRGFFHLDERYPNGISMPVITEDYETNQWDYSAFVNHPVHGMCFAQEWYKKELWREQQYLRLYKMDDVLAEINRRLLAAAQNAINK